MSDSEDEVEAVVHSVTNYYFEDEQSEPISFSALPVKWSKSEEPAIGTRYLFLNGISDSGVEKIYKKVIAWKVEFSNEQPKISVLEKEQSWIELQKPRKSFEDTIRTILITIHCLHFLRKHPETSEGSMWTYLQKILSLYRAKPSENDLLVHLPIIQAAVVNDKVFSKSKFLLKLLNGTKKRKVLNEDLDHDILVKKTKVAAESDKEFNKETGKGTATESDKEFGNGNEPIQVWDLCDDVCALCDNGGELVCCEGRCLRSFHATVETGFVSGCKSLCLSKDQVNANFTCMNCQFKEHQCFACGKLGSSDVSKNPEVFRCASVTCGHFYHPRCVAKLLHPINGHAADQVQKKIISGGSFICTVHKCYVCKKEEDERDKEMQFAICRRCPKVYHRKCLPREISTETLLDEGILQRAWMDLLPNRILIYCLKHEIDVSTLTPVEKYIKFPNVQEKKKLCQPDLQSKHGTTKRGNVNPRNEPVIKVHSSIKGHASTKVHVNKASEVKLGSKKKSERFDASRFFMKGRVRCKSQKVVKSIALDESNGHRKEESQNKVLSKGLKYEHPRQQIVACSQTKKTVEHSKKQSHSPPTLRFERRMREVELVREKSSLDTIDIVEEIPKDASPLTFTNNITDNSNRLEKAVEVLEEKVEDDCSGVVTTSNEPEYFDQLTKSMIADKILYYTRDGDTILNFCCHDTSFSCMMREKFVEAEKQCSVQNYDLFESKGIIDFGNKDWIPTTSRLIVGLIFPKGVGGVSIKELIDKILELKKPKLLLLICPKETEGLEQTSLFCMVDEKEVMYQLIWEEDDYFSCKAKKHTTSAKSPVLHLWSRWDWTKTYKPIALRAGQLPKSDETDKHLLDITNQVNLLGAESSQVEETKLHFVPGPLPSFANSSCGWLVE